MILIGLGANLSSPAGPPRDTLKAALAELSLHGPHIAATSSYYTSPAWPDPADPPFVNAVARVETSLLPAELLALLHRTEDAFGRVRSARNAPRTLDLDLIDYDGRVEAGPPVLPHPRLADRVFVLTPMSDIAPDWRHPVTGQTIAALIAALPPGARAIEKLTA
jgi:2-amino-4-hydroxy-6-hydroxymethyldihydropteridine diphosphokinase